MKKIILVGSVASGKTTLLQRIHGRKIEYKKTQALEVINKTIDTPGEYLEHRAFFSSLIITSVDCDQVLFILDPTQERFMYSPGQASAFPIPVAGVVTKTDIADEEQISDAKELLALAGADPIFEVSSYEGTGVEELMKFLEE